MTDAAVLREMLAERQRLAQMKSEEHDSHNATGTSLLSALLHISLFILFQRHTLPSLHALDRHILLTRSMEPFQSLDQAPIHVVDADGPLATADFNRSIVPREVEFWQKDLCRHFLSCGRFALEGKCENSVS